ncbi:autotransporter assembly complex protein TamA [Taylorella equigenitalis]|uniref:Exported protein n=2 Tax=Taylorella equigenitalis TaxID=29575 RepID=A0ABN4AU96_9BURK|nr:BamA/TamA family outer membrane protein [Taylorella equigenitalis]AFN35428.1 putative exported protein [Taylorella equigenitalis ATCC 35865]ASY37390.1 outer membrane protein assembly factor [Taylorella equigenitalis]ASY38856.1 outer membrane protein assembly factor [Taylorella equigenitalis]ASY41814.1 outer membrane protein assembly factor [Taylorella equigenitalis]KGK33366.1 surface antigen [Taylorella equigenitalis]
MRLGTRVLQCLLFFSATSTFAAHKPEVLIIPSGLSPEELTAVQKAISAVVRQADDQDGGEAARIRRKGHESVVTALATMGYYAPVVTLEVGQDIGGDTWDISIEAGEQSKVTQATTQFEGAISKPKHVTRVQSIKASWGLPEGSAFLNKNWSKSKNDILDVVLQRDFYLARLSQTRAVVDPKQSSVETLVVIDSGPEVKLGHIEIFGLRRVPRKIVEKYLNYKPGKPYDKHDFDDWVSLLQQTNYFRGVFINPIVPNDPNLMKKDVVELPVQVRVTEAPASTLAGSIGVDDSVGLHAEAVYRQNIIIKQPLVIEGGAGVDKDAQRAYFDVYFPPNQNHSVDSMGVMIRRSKIHNEKVLRFGFGFRRKRDFKLDPDSNVEWSNGWAIMANRDRIERPLDRKNPEFILPSIVATYEVVRRDIKSKEDPRSGHAFGMGVGIGHNFKQHKMFYRASLRGQYWFPVGKKDAITIRGEIGRVWAGKDTLYPDDFAYRTGGARSIRGYKYYGLGKNIGETIVGAKNLAVLSAEYQRYFNDTFGMSAFIDVGNAAEKLKDMKPKVGVGFGALVKTPAGPLKADLAWAINDKKIRLHFTLGASF